MVHSTDAITKKSEAKMASFKDATGRLWIVAINVGTIRNVMNATQVNLGTLLADDMNPLNDLCSNPIALVNCLYWICKTSDANESVSEEEFAKCLLGESYENAINAFLEALIDFFPKRQANLLKTMISKGTELQDSLAPQLGKLIDKQMQEISSKVASALQESPG